MKLALTVLFFILNSYSQHNLGKAEIGKQFLDHLERTTDIKISWDTFNSAHRHTCAESVQEKFGSGMNGVGYKIPETSSYIFFSYLDSKGNSQEGAIVVYDGDFKNWIPEISLPGVSKQELNTSLNVRKIYSNLKGSFLDSNGDEVMVTIDENHTDGINLATLGGLIYKCQKWWDSLYED